MIVDFKVFERKLEPKYNIGDTVLLDDDTIIIGRIIDWESWIDIESPDYYIEIFDKQHITYFNRHWVDESEILRKIDKDEMKILLNANKYNL